MPQTNQLGKATRDIHIAVDGIVGYTRVLQRKHAIAWGNELNKVIGFRFIHKEVQAIGIRRRGVEEVRIGIVQTYRHIRNTWLTSILKPV